MEEEWQAKSSMEPLAWPRIADEKQRNKAMAVHLTVMFAAQWRPA